MAHMKGHGTNIAFGQNTPAPPTDGTAFGWSSDGDSDDSSYGNTAISTPTPTPNPVAFGNNNQGR